MSALVNNVPNFYFDNILGIYKPKEDLIRGSSLIGSGWARLASVGKASSSSFPCPTLKNRMPFGCSAVVQTAQSMKRAGYLTRVLPWDIGDLDLWGCPVVATEW